MDKEIEMTVRGFFERAGVAGLLLPDGWFGGRPMEGHHRLTFVRALAKRLLIELDGNVLISVVGNPKVHETTTEYALAERTPTLVIEGFSQAVVEYLEYVNETPHVTSYGDGSIFFVSPT